LPQTILVQAVIKKGKVKGSVTVPASKSMLQRYMIAALLAQGETELNSARHCNDTVACLKAVQSFGATVIDDKDGLLKMKGNGSKLKLVSNKIDCGESGFALRALSAVAAISNLEIQLTGSGSLSNRPIGFMMDVFRQLDVKCTSSNGLLPLTMQGPVKYKDIITDGSISSQFLSGLLMIFPMADEDHIIEVHSLKSRLYIDLTLDVLKEFGIIITNENYIRFFIPGRQQYKGCSVNVEGDWSAASCMLVAGAVAGEVTVKNLSLKSNQPDKIILQVLNETGAEVLMSENEVTVRKPGGKILSPFCFDATDCPDLFPALTVLASQCNGVSEITGVERLFHKESNRATTLQNEFSKLKNDMISIEGNTMKIEGGKLIGTEVHSHHDHRIAMALAVAGLIAEGETVITDSDSVSKSYPEFFNDLSGIITYE
jgi:3-phosphoshikimate 1-carboxyvinyltransferase